MLVAQYEQPIRVVVDEVSTIGLQAGASVLGLTALALVGLPVLVHRHAWAHVDDATETATASLEDVSERFPVEVPDRVEIRTLDHPKPAVSLFDDGRDAVIAFTTGADDVLDDREREALIVRENSRIGERDAVPSFWASALALGVAERLEERRSDRPADATAASASS